MTITMLLMFTHSYNWKTAKTVHFPIHLTLNAPIATKVVCFSRLLKCLRSLYGKQCGPKSDCSYRSSLFWVHAVCFYTQFISNVRQLFAADDSSRRLQQTTFSDAFFSWRFKGQLHLEWPKFNNKVLTILSAKRYYLQEIDPGMQKCSLQYQISN